MSSSYSIFCLVIQCSHFVVFRIFWHHRISPERKTPDTTRICLLLFTYLSPFCNRQHRVAILETSVHCCLDWSYHQRLCTLFYVWLLFVGRIEVAWSSTWRQVYYTYSIDPIHSLFIFRDLWNFPSTRLRHWYEYRLLVMDELHHLPSLLFEYFLSKEQRAKQWKKDRPTRCQENPISRAHIFPIFPRLTIYCIINSTLTHVYTQVILVSVRARKFSFAIVLNFKRYSWRSAFFFRAPLLFEFFVYNSVGRIIEDGKWCSSISIWKYFKSESRVKKTAAVRNTKINFSFWDT